MTTAPDPLSLAAFDEQGLAALSPLAFGAPINVSSGAGPGPARAGGFGLGSGWPVALALVVLAGVALAVFIRK